MKAYFPFHRQIYARCTLDTDAAPIGDSTSCFFTAHTASRILPTVVLIAIKAFTLSIPRRQTPSTNVIYRVVIPTFPYDSCCL